MCMAELVWRSWYVFLLAELEILTGGAGLTGGARMFSLYSFLLAELVFVAAKLWRCDSDSWR